MSNKDFFKLEFNPNDYPKYGNLEKFYKDAFTQCHQLLKEKKINARDLNTLENLQQFKPNSGFIYSKSGEELLESQQQNSLEAIIEKLGLKIFIDGSQKGDGTIQCFRKLYYLIGVKLNSNIYVRVVSMRKLVAQSEQELLNYYIVHFYEYQQDRSSANIQLINDQQNDQMEFEMERQRGRPAANQPQIKQEFEVKQESGFRNQKTNRVDFLENQIYELQKNQKKQDADIQFLNQKIAKMEDQIKKIEVIQNQQVIVLQDD
ncbi:hypothetical protein ABPG74_019441 [Tetrahymena malaccensis]